jgi:hypothetical protein
VIACQTPLASSPIRATSPSSLATHKPNTRCAVADPITFAVLGQDQRPSSVAVYFVVTAGAGTVPIPTAVTDAHGQVSTTWTLGTGAGAQILEARVTGLKPARASAGTSGCALAECPFPSSPNLDVITPLTLSTYDHSGQVVHPDVALAGAFADSSSGSASRPIQWQCWLRESFIFQRERALLEAHGATNPMSSDLGYLDPDIVIDLRPTSARRVYRQVIGGRNLVHLRRSDDGIH